MVSQLQQQQNINFRKAAAVPREQALCVCVKVHCIRGVSQVPKQKQRVRQVLQVGFPRVPETQGSSRRKLTLQIVTR